MSEYPIYVPRDPYSGNDPRKIEKSEHYNEIAEKVEKFINKKIHENNDEIQTYSSRTIALELGYNPEFIAKMLFPIDCGSNGFTVKKAELIRSN